MIELLHRNGLYLPEAGLWLDPPAAQPFAFVSHAHADHFARHQRVLCSAATAELLRVRFRVAAERLLPVSGGAEFEHAGFRLRLLPAGHIHGSAMLHATRLRDGATLLYTGDFKVRRGRCAEPATFLHAELLVMETTYGQPRYVFPPPLEVEHAVLRFVHGAFDDGATPVLLGYALGKAQEALALLDAHGIPALLHPQVAEMTAACRASGAALPEPVVLDGPAPPGHAVIAPPTAVRSPLLRAVREPRTAMLSGWALQAGTRYRFRVDEAIPLSDHADHPGLLECVRRVRPRRVVTVHGYAREFAAELRARGIDAWSATGGDQMEFALEGARVRAEVATGPRHPRPACQLAGFSDLCRRLGETASRRAKTAHLADYLRSLANERDLAIVACWLTGRPLPRHQAGGVLPTGGALLRRALLAVPGAREARYREISLAQSDAACTARIVLQELPLAPVPLDFAELDGFFRALAAAGGALARIELLAARLATLHPAEGESLVKLLTGDLRIGLAEGLVEEAVAVAFDADPAAVRRAGMLTGDLGETAVLARAGRLAEAAPRPFAPLDCMLAAPAPDSAAVVRAAADQPGGCWLEPNHGGLRAQLHKCGSAAALFSRDLRPLGSAFPELLEAARLLRADCILDGEVIADGPERRLGFDGMQAPAGRLATHPDLFAAADPAVAGRVPPRVRFVAFDILWLDGVGMLDRPLAARRRALESLALAGRLETTTVIRAAGAGEVEAAFEAARAAGHAGLIAKDPGAPYSPGGRGAAWLALKSERSAGLET